MKIAGSEHSRRPQRWAAVESRTKTSEAMTATAKGAVMRVSFKKSKIMVMMTVHKTSSLLIAKNLSQYIS